MEKERPIDVATLCTMLFEEDLFAKLNLRRGLVRLCAHFEELLELDNPHAGDQLTTLLVLLK